MKIEDFCDEKTTRSIKICLLLPPKDCSFNNKSLKFHLISFHESEKPMEIIELENK